MGRRSARQIAHPTSQHGVNDHSYFALRSNVTSDDTVPTVFDPVDFSETLAAGVADMSAIAIRAWGTAAAAKTATLTLVKWVLVPPYDAFAVAPGTVLWKGLLTTGTKDSGTIEPFPGWGSSANWFEIDTWDEAAGSGWDYAQVIKLGGSSYGGYSELVVPTLNADYITAYISGLGGGSGMTEIGLMAQLYGTGPVL